MSEQVAASTDSTLRDRDLVGDIIFGRWRSQTLYAAVKLGLFDVLSTSEPKSITDIAEQAKVDRDMCYRLLRALASIGLLHEEVSLDGASRREGSKFCLTSAGALLQSNHERSMAGAVLLEECPEHVAIWKHLPDMVQDGKQNGFVREYGMMAFDYASTHPTYDDTFNTAMSSFSRTQSENVVNALRDHDFSQATSACDIAGGHGYNLCYFMKHHPNITNGIVLDLPIVINHTQDHLAESMGMGDKCNYVAGDMFDSKTIPQTDLYFMKMILHDWNDDECLQILKAIRNAAAANKPGGTRLLICENVIPDPNTPSLANFFDIHMACWGTGRERTATEHRKLLEASGWKYVDCFRPDDGGYTCVVEAVLP